MPLDVFRRRGEDDYVPFVRVNLSRALAQLESHADNLGVYAARDFLKGNRLGRYTGLVVERGEPFSDDASYKNEIRKLREEQKGNYIMQLSHCTLRGEVMPQSMAEQKRLLGLESVLDVPFPDREWLIDTQFSGTPDHVWPDMYPHLINDPRGLGGLAANVEIDVLGFIVAARDINAGEELLMSYGDAFWEDDDDGDDSDDSDYVTNEC